MSRYIPKGQHALNILWHLIKPDGTPFSLEGYDYTLSYKTGRGEVVVASSQISGDNRNIVSFILTTQEQLFIGAYSLSLSIIQNGLFICRIKYQDAFTLTNGEGCTCPMEEEQGETPQMINLFSATEFYLFQPVIPTIGINRHWYVDGVDTGKSSHSKITVIAEGENRGRIIFDEGEPEEVIYDGLKNALDTADTDHVTALEDHETAETDHIIALQDHVTALEDHAIASQDHVTALEDHDRQVLSVTVEYAPGASATVPPSTGWSPDIPAVSAGHFLWCRTTTVYNDSDLTPTVGYSIGLLTLLDGAVTINKLANEAKPVIIAHAASDLSVTDAVPNALHVWTNPLSTLIVNSLAAPEHPEIANEYRFRFTTADDWNPDNTVFPTGIRWVEEPYFQPNMTYEVSIENGYGIAAEWEDE